MKYITTKENPIFKEGIEFEKIKNDINSIGTWINVNDGLHKISPWTFDDWLKKGYIKEVEKPEFTKSDVIGIVGAWFNSDSSIPFDQYFDDWIENIAKSNN